MPNTEKRFTVCPPLNDGTYAERFGWTVVDRRMNPNLVPLVGSVIASGSEADCRAMARSMNARKR